jgi:hypothetical protein
MKWKRIELIFQNFTYKCTVICLINYGREYITFWSIRFSRFSFNVVVKHMVVKSQKETKTIIGVNALFPGLKHLILTLIYI